MRRGIKNDKVVKAITLGLATMMALSNPVSVYASEEAIQPQPETTPSNVDGGVADEAQAANESAQISVNNASESVDTVADDISENVVPEDAGFGVDVDGITEANIPDNVAISPEIDTNLIVAENASQSEAFEAAIATSKVSNASNVADSAKAEAEAASDKAKEYSETIINAKTVKEAQEAYDSLAALISDTQASLDAKQNDYNNLKAAYDEAAKNIVLMEEVYNLAVATASDSAGIAAGNLAIAESELSTLKEQLDAAKAAVDAYSSNALSIIDAQNAVKDNTSVNWKAEDNIMITILKNYYLPEVEKLDSIQKIERVSGVDNDLYNYFKVTYKDSNGMTAYKYYNYNMDSASKNKIVIFEKRENEIQANDAEVAAKKNKTETLLYTDGVEVDSYKYASGTSTDSFSQADFDKDVADENIVSFDGDTVNDYSKGQVAYKKGSTNVAGLPDDIVAGEERDEETGITTDTKISEREISYVEDEYGDVHELVKQDVTVYTYTDKSFTSSRDYETEAEARQAAMDDANAAMQEGDKNLSVNVTSSIEYKADTTYVDLFADTIELSRKVDIIDLGFYKEDAQKINMKEISKDIPYYQEGEVYTATDGTKHYIVEANVSEPVTTRVDKHLFNGLIDKYETKVSISVSTAKIDTDETELDKEMLKAYGYEEKEVVGSRKEKKEIEKANAESLDAAINRYIEAKKEELSKCDYYYSNFYYDFGKNKFVLDTVSKKTFNGTAAADIESAKNQFNNSNALVLNTDLQTVTKYGYDGSYLSLEDTNNETYTVAYTEYRKLKGVVVQNKNYKDGNIALNEKDDKAFNEFINEAAAKKQAAQDKYDRLIMETKAAQEKVIQASADVADLQEKIADLKENAPDKSKELEGLENELKLAKDKLKEANDKLDSLKEKLGTAEEDLKDTKRRLTPKPAKETKKDDEPYSDGSTAPAVAVPLVATPALAGDAVVSLAAADDSRTVATAATAGVAGARVDSGERLHDTANEEKTDTLTNKNTVAVKPADSVDKTSVEAGSTVIADEDVPLAAIPDEDRNNMNWWWLVVVALLGTTGYAMYKNHEKKAKEKAALKEEIKKES